jgi:solute:Na+ symporter, SSS family
MQWIDWLVMLSALLGIAAYGIWKTRAVQTTGAYLRGDDDRVWWAIGLNIMATQASAITFLSTPGQAYEDGMRFVQFYYGLPIAMIILSIFVLPNYYRLQVYTAYEYLETRFGRATRLLTAGLFLTQRGLAAGLTIYAPSIVLSQILNWPLNWTILFMGIVVILYTVSGGSKAVSVTQTLQMVVMMGGLLLAAVLIVYQLPQGMRLSEAVGLAGKMGKMNVVDFQFNLDNRYNFWSGVIGGTFLFLSYFGTDQSQVSRYLGGKSLTESRLGLMFNGLLKIPMQFVILLVGLLVAVFYQFNPAPLHFNQANVQKLSAAGQRDYGALEKNYAQLQSERKTAAKALLNGLKSKDEATTTQAQNQLKAIQERDQAIRESAKALILKEQPKAVTRDTDYVFISYVLRYMPLGVIGLLLAMIFAAAWSSTASELNALATTSLVDIYRTTIVKNADDRHYLIASKALTVLWGCLALIFALTAQLFDNLIQAVNIIGSIFYGVILGVFLSAFFLKQVQGRAVFIAAVITQIMVIAIYWMSEKEVVLNLLGWQVNVKIAYLWLNLIGCLGVMGLATIIQTIAPERDQVSSTRD